MLLFFVLVKKLPLAEKERQTNIIIALAQDRNRKSQANRYMTDKHNAAKDRVKEIGRKERGRIARESKRSGGKKDKHKKG